MRAGYLLVFLFLVGPVWLGLGLLCLPGGCHVGQNQYHPGGGSSEGDMSFWARRWARIPPGEIDNRLTQAQLDKMFVALDDVPFEKVALEEKSGQLLPRKDIEKRAEAGKGSVVGCKAYLRGRWLLEKAGGRVRPDLRKQAIHELNAGLASDPNSAALHQLLAEAYFTAGDEIAAVKACQRAIEIDSNSMTAYYLIAVIRLKGGNYRQAASAVRSALVCTKAVESNPITAVAYMQLGAALKEMGYLTASAQSYQEAWRLLTQQSSYTQSSMVAAQLVAQRHIPLLALADLHLKMGYVGLAAEVLPRGQAILPVSKNFVKMFVMSLTNQKISLQLRYRQVVALCRYLLATSVEPESQLRIFHEACARMAKYQSYLEELSRWYNLSDGGRALLTPRLYAYGLSLAAETRQAEKILKDVSSSGDEIAFVHRDLARLYAKTQQWPEMILEYGAYLQIMPDKTEMVLAELEDVLAMISDLPAELQQWRCEDRFAGAYAGFFLLGCIAQGRGDDDMAEKFYRQALADESVESGFAPALPKLIELLLKHGRYEEVLKCLERNRDEPELLHYAGRACLGLGELERAARCYRRLIKLQEYDIRAYLALGEVLYKQNAFAGAEEIFLQVMDHWPGRQEVYRELLILYARWNAQPDLDRQLQRATETRSHQMLQYWLKGGQENSHERENRVREGKIIAILEELSHEYPRGYVIGVMLSRLYRAQRRHDEALREMERLLTCYPQDERLLTIAAELNEKYGDMHRAARQRKQLWASNPQDAELLLGCLRTLRLAGKAEDALSLLLIEDQQGERQIDAAAVEVLQIEALRLFMITRRYREAVDLFRKWYERVYAPAACDQDAVESEAVQIAAENLLWALTQAGCYDRAIQRAKMFYQRYPRELMPSVLWLVRTLNVRLLYPQSRSLLDELLRQQPGELSLRVLWYWTMIEQGDTEEAIAAAGKWFAEKPDDKKRLRTLVLLLRRVGDYETAISRLRQYLATAPQDEKLQLLLVNTMVAAEDFDQAEEILSRHGPGQKDYAQWIDAWIKFDMACGRCPQAISRIDGFAGEARGTSRINHLKARILSACGQAEQALELQEKIVEQDPCDVDARLQYSVFLDRMGHKRQAAIQLEVLLKAYHDDAGIKNNLGYLLVESHWNADRAGRLLRESLRTDPESAPTLDSLGWFYYKNGQFGPALVYIYQAAAEMVMPDSEILDHLGDTVYQLGRREQAHLYWQRALDQLQKRVKTERYLNSHKVRIESKLRQLAEGGPVTVAVLFEEEPRDN